MVDSLGMESETRPLSQPDDPPSVCQRNCLPELPVVIMHAILVTDDSCLGLYRIVHT